MSFCWKFSTPFICQLLCWRHEILYECSNLLQISQFLFSTTRHKAQCWTVQHNFAATYSTETWMCTAGVPCRCFLITHRLYKANTAEGHFSSISIASKHSPYELKWFHTLYVKFSCVLIATPSRTIFKNYVHIIISIDEDEALGEAGSAFPGLKGLCVFSNVPAQIVDLPAQPRRPATIQRLIYKQMAKVTRQQPLAKQEVHVQA